MDKKQVAEALQRLPRSDQMEILGILKECLEGQFDKYPDGYYASRLRADGNFCLHRLTNPEKFDELHPDWKTEIESVPVFSDFVVVEHSGMENEKVVKSGYRNSANAQGYIARNYSKSEMKSIRPSVMKRFSDGSLTTEF